MVLGAQCVMTSGTQMLLKWSAENLDFRQRWLLIDGLTLDKETVPSGWTMSDVQGERIVSVDALIMVGGHFKAAVMWKIWV